MIYNDITFPGVEWQNTTCKLIKLIFIKVEQVETIVNAKPVETISKPY